MSENKLRVKAFLIWGICALFFLYEFFLRTVIGSYQHPLTQDLNITSFQFSLLSTTIFLLIYGLMQIPAGIIINNIGLKKSLTIGAVCCTFSAFGFANAYNYELAIIYRMIMGLGASFGFICLLISVHEWMPRKYNAIFIGLSQFIGTIGPMAAAGPLESLSHSANIDWRFIFLCLGGVGLILTILVFLFVENNQEKTGKYLILQKPEKISKAIFKLFSRAQPWCIAFLSASLYFTIEYLSENEGRSFLILKNISPQSAAYMITISWFGYALGCPLMGFLSDMLERRKIILQLCASMALIAIIMILYLPNKMHLQIAFFTLGLSASGQSIGFATIAEQFNKHFVAIGFGLNNAMITTIAAINAPLIGLLLDYTKSEQNASLNDYLLVFNVLILVSIIAIVISLFFLKETYCKSAVEFSIITPKKRGGSAR